MAELDLDGRDYISRLPDELLLIMLSKLDLSNGARTTILSTRWRNLWTFPTNSTVLRFDASDMILDTEYFQRYRKHVSMNMKLELIVDQTLAHYTGDVIDELNISYLPSEFDTPMIGLRKPWAKVDTWVEFAKKKQVKTLSLSFELFDSCQPAPYKPSPLKSLTSTTLLSLVTLRLKSPPQFSEGSIESLLSSFPNLEELSVAKVKFPWHSIVIKGSSLKLKHLELIDLDFYELRLSAPNLLSFNFIGCKISFATIRLRKVPLLTQLSYEFDYLGCGVNPLSYSDFVFFESNRDRFPTEMKNLKQLKFTLGSHMDNALHVFFRLLGASPSLYKLWLNLGVIECPLIKNHQFAINKCLEEVEIDGLTQLSYEFDYLG